MNARGMVRRAGLTLGVCLLAVSAHAQATATQKPAQQPFEPKSRTGGQGRRLGANVAGARRQDARHGQGDAAGLRHGPRVGRWPHGDHRRQARRDRHGRSSTTPTWSSCRRRTPPRRTSAAKATFVKADLFETDFSKATVITMFLLPEINVKLRPKILNLKPGTRVVSNSFTMEDWEADQTETISRRVHELVHRASLDRAGQGRGHVDDAAGRSQAHADVSEDLGNARRGQDRRQDERRHRSRSPRARRPTPAR